MAGTEFQIVTWWRSTASAQCERILVTVGGRDDHDGAAGAQDAEQIEDRQVELERRDPEHAIVRADDRSAR